MVMYFEKHDADAAPERSARITELVSCLDRTADDADQIDGNRIGDIRSQLLGCEGGAARVYWEGIATLLESHAPFPCRSGRGAVDPINALLTYGHGVLSQAIWAAVLNAGLEPYAGCLHTDRPGQPSLILDLMEECRAPIVDRPVIALCRRGESVKIEQGKLDIETGG